MNKRYDLNKNWKFTLSTTGNTNFPKAIKNKWIKASVPGTVHTDLLNAGLIDEPFYSDNEKRLEWICEQDWLYKTQFDLPKNWDVDDLSYLVFDGLDTIAEIKLNGELVGKSENMFLKYELAVSKYLKEKKNTLEILFKSPLQFCRTEENKYGVLPVALNSYRVYIRKAQYSFGWDWGPSFPTMGIWRSVYLLKKENIEIKSLSFDTSELTGSSAKTEIRFVLQGNTKEHKVIILLSDSEGVTVHKIIEAKEDINRVGLEVNSPKLWNPNGAGEQNLYVLTIQVTDAENNIVIEISKKVGIRKLELQLEENGAPAFRFIINNRKLFAKGVNWIPGDAFLPRVNKEKYRTLLESAKKANCNFIRVWGGGIYEDDYFYELCDELGLMVWQDFMFACGAYPEHNGFLENVKIEIEQNVNRLKHHTSIVIWCGNNENEWLWYQDTHTSYTKMPGYKIYHSLIPSVLKNTDPNRPYWPSSPFGSDEDPNSQTSGNRHQWDVWSRWIDYTEVYNDRSLFVTEFGFQGPANKSTLEKFIPKKHRKIHDEIFEWHNKQVQGTERVIRFLSAHLPLNTKWDDFIYLAQLNQGFALKACLEHWRTNWPQTNGSVIWQINDTWPVTSWSLIDSEMNEKLSYHFVKNAFSPVIISFRKTSNKVEIFGLNQSTAEFNGLLDVKFIEAHSGKISRSNWKKVSINIDSYSVIDEYKIPELKDNELILVTTLYDEDGNIVHRNYGIEKRWKHITLPKAKVKIKHSNKKHRNELILSTNKPAFFVDLYYPGYKFEERGMIILPGEKYSIKYTGKSKKEIDVSKIEIKTLNDYLKD